MIKSKKLFGIALVLFIVSEAINFPFPNKNPFGEPVVSIFNFPTQTVHGLNYVGISGLLIFIMSLFFLTRSLEKYHVRAVLFAIIIASFLPSIIAQSYQKTLATGVYAVNYDEEMSSCHFEIAGESTLNGECELPFENYSDDDVRFSIEFYDKYNFEDERPMVSLMNIGEPYEVNLKGKESKTVKINTKIDVSNMENHIDGGSASSVNIIIRSGEKSREL